MLFPCSPALCETPGILVPALKPYQSLTLVDNEAAAVSRLRDICQNVLKCPAEEFGLLKPILPTEASFPIL